LPKQVTTNGRDFVNFNSILQLKQMFFERILPPDELKNIVECYWIAENSDPTSLQEKIIPDGFPEIIFHYGDPYRIKLKDQWELQSASLYAGQITKHFYLRNCGVSKVLGVKLRPTACRQLYGHAADSFTDKVVDLRSLPGISSQLVEEMTSAMGHYREKVATLNYHFLSLLSSFKYDVAEKAVEMIFASNGMVSITDLTASLCVTERQLERVFRQYVGLSPKFYCRIIRFSWIFQCIQKKDVTWADVVHDAGFYDQSHFIRNFKAFTGEEPSSYLFEENNMANFFLQKKGS
jgi:AraC-like DNA-binding protein